jgi:hypothetical protein
MERHMTDLVRIRDRLRKRFFSSRVNALKMMIAIGVVFWSVPMWLFAMSEIADRASFPPLRLLVGTLVLILGGVVLGASFWALACLRWSSSFDARKDGMPDKKD